MKGKILFMLVLVFSIASVLLSSCGDYGEEPEPEPKLNAYFSANGYLRPTPGEVVFENESTLAVEYSWDFGDGDTSSLEHPSHTFKAKGEYTVVLRAFAEDGEVDEYSKTVKMYGSISGFNVKDVFIDQIVFGSSPNTSDPDDGGFPDVTFTIEDTKGNLILDPGSYFPDWEFSEEDYTTAIVFRDEEIDNLPFAINSMTTEYVIKVYDYNTSDWTKTLMYSKTFKGNDIVPADNSSAYPAYYYFDELESVTMNLSWID